MGVPYQPRTDPEPRRLQAPARLALVVVVSSINRATVRAIRYARSLNPSEIKAMCIQIEPGEAAVLTAEWSRLGIGLPLEIVDSPFRDLMQPLLREVEELRYTSDDAVGVVVPEFVLPRWWQNLLHTQTAFFIKAALLFVPEVIVINVPLRLRLTRAKKEKDDAAPAAAPAAEKVLR